jgi:UDP-N-acetylmuramate dehydrogenase
VIKIRKNVKLAPLSTFGIGGRTEYFCSVRKPDELVKAVLFAKKTGVPWRVFAGGSNVVFPDEKMKGLLIRFYGGWLTRKGNVIVADGGASLARVVSASVKFSLKGLETLSGIPGTLGGAIVGNAGAYGHSISEIVRRVEVWDGKERHWIKRSNCNFGYRESVFKHKNILVLRAELVFKKGKKKELKKTSREIIKIREKKYRPGLKCPGSFFKNILAKDVSIKSLNLIDKKKIIEGKIPAGYLLEEVGARGMKLGGVRIAKFHSNLLINGGRAKAKEVKKMAELLKKRVRQKFGIELAEEVRYF